MFDLKALGERTDHARLRTCCRPTAAPAPRAITGAFVAAHDAVSWLIAQRRIATHADPRPRRRGLGRYRRGHAAARPRVHRRLGLRHRHERRDDRRRGLRRGAGHGRGRETFSRAEMDAPARNLPTTASATLVDGAARGRTRTPRQLIAMRLVLASNNAKQARTNCSALLRAGSASNWLAHVGELGVDEARGAVTALSSRTRSPRHAMRPAAAHRTAGARRRFRACASNALGGAPGVHVGAITPSRWRSILRWIAKGDRRAQDAANNVPCCSTACAVQLRPARSFRRHAGGRLPLGRRSRAADRGRSLVRSRCSKRRAVTGGFGYDPLMSIPSLHRSVAELDDGRR